MYIFMKENVAFCRMKLTKGGELLQEQKKINLLLLNYIRVHVYLNFCLMVITYILHKYLTKEKYLAFCRIELTRGGFFTGALYF